ncbi:hypothetical protein BV898_10903 [Hypsibius exemplaris]|uniref:Glycosyltransferase family 92 protein n=1 Tax=Hypsibius exemplaris TaxID=2072580 RepID=A0A1W0WI34_HYPEX|nr:hypothetical protein BV898_10903 [Hypsibius exemplaris]
MRSSERIIVNLTICVMIRNEVPYLVEWCDHHFRQSVDQFVLYDDHSTDDTSLVPFLYHRDSVSLYSANPYRNNKVFHDFGAMHMEKQLFILKHCNARSAGRSQYIAAIDVDEFLTSPRSGTIWKYIEQAKLPAQLRIKSIRYGTSGLKRDFSGQITIDPFCGSVEVLAANNETAKGAFPLVRAANPRRAPHPELDDDFEALYNRICLLNKTREESLGCTHADGKSIWRPDLCQVAGVHGCESRQHGGTFKAPLEGLRLNHFAFRSREHVETLNSLLKPTKKAAFDAFDANWFSLRYDPIIGKEKREVTCLFC